MAIVVRYTPLNLTRDQYDRVNESLAEETGLSKDELPDGSSSTCCSATRAA